MSYVIGVDLGTSGTKTVLFDEIGNVIASHTVEYPLYQEKNGWAEQDPLDWYNATITTIKAVLEKSNIDSKDIKGIGLSGQMHGLVMLDKDYNVLRKSIIWCDQRTGKECEELTEIVGAEKVIEITANPILTGFTASKIRWVMKNEPKIFEKCRYILLPKDYVRLMLTGELATEVSDASGMQLLDVPNRRWSSVMLDALNITEDMLGKVYESPDVTGEVTQKVADITGLKKGTIVVGGAGDNAAAAVGTGVVEDGKAFTTIGTSGVVFAHTSNVTIDTMGRVHTFCCAVPNCWHVMGVTQGAGLSLKWFRDNFCTSEKETAKLMGVDEYYLMDKEAEKIPVGADRLLYLPYLMGERTPHLDPNARGMFFGLSAIHGKSHMLRAVLEGVAYSLRDCVEVFREMNINVNNMMACGGGGTSPLWRQMLADLYACPVKTVSSKEGPALGVGILALTGSRIYSSVQEACKTIIRVDKVQSPIEENVPQYEKYYQLYREIYPAIKEQCQKLANL
ncbi:MAG: xylulokinase [Ruminococcus sp.]|nr:xylulokinase [Ruminococcus sp.]